METQRKLTNISGFSAASRFREAADFSNILAGTQLDIPEIDRAAISRAMEQARKASGSPQLAEGAQSRFGTGLVASAREAAARMATETAKNTEKTVEKLENIRKLLRVYKQDPSPDNQASYWRACLRAGELPEPDESVDGSWVKVWQFGRDVDVSVKKVNKGWVRRQRKSKYPYLQNRVRLERQLVGPWDEAQVEAWIIYYPLSKQEEKRFLDENWMEPPSVAFETQLDAHQYVKYWLSWILEKNGY
jgi:hypothetical protein